MRLQLPLQRSSLGRDLFRLVLSHLGLEDPEGAGHGDGRGGGSGHRFGLRFADPEEPGTARWVDQDREIRKQAKLDQGRDFRSTAFTQTEI